MTDSMIDDDQHQQPERQRPPARAAGRLKTWSGAQDAWRFNRRMNRRYLNNLLRVRSATVLPKSMRARIAAMGIPEDIITETLREIRSLDQWTNAWIETAQRFLGDYRRQISGSQRADAAQARMLAGLCYHIAQLIPGSDDRTVEHCRATASTLFGQALGEIMPQARQLDIPWRNEVLPSILIPGPDTEEASGLVVVLNGTSTIKEEVLRWVDVFKTTGHAVLLVDSPGTGEARHLGPPSADHDDLLDGVFEWLQGYPAIDPRRVTVMGVSLGANSALRCVTNDRRIVGSVLVSPPYDPSRWIERVSQLEHEELAALFHIGLDDDLVAAAQGFSLAEVAPRVSRPTLIIAGARDVVVPPADATRLASALGDHATLVWYPNGGHVLYEEIPAWTADAAYWLDAIMKHQPPHAGDAAHAAQWRDALDRLPVTEPGWDDSMESARLLSPDEIDSSFQPDEDDEFLPSEPREERDSATARRAAPAARADREPADDRRSRATEEPREYDDAYSRAFDEDSGQRRSGQRPSRARQQPPEYPLE